MGIFGVRLQDWGKRLSGNSYTLVKILKYLDRHRRAERSYSTLRSGGAAMRRYSSSNVRSSSCALLEQL